MPARLKRPAAPVLQAFLATQADEAFSYQAVGATRTGERVPGYDLDRARVCLGTGEPLFRAASAALRAWRMFPPRWTAIFPPAALPVPGTSVAMLARVMGLWWLNACRVVYTLDASPAAQRCGFAYGTLPAHVEQGEELFLVERLPDGTVWYEVRSFRARAGPVVAGYPLARLYQHRFVRHSQAALLDALGESR